MLVGVIKFSAAFRTRSGQLRRKLKGILWVGRSTRHRWARSCDDVRVLQTLIPLSLYWFYQLKNRLWTVCGWSSRFACSICLSLSLCLSPPPSHTHTHRLVCFSFILFICGSDKKTAYTGNYADTWLARVPFFLRKLQRSLPAGRTGRRLSDLRVTVNFVAIWFFFSTIEYI